MDSNKDLLEVVEFLKNESKLSKEKVTNAQIAEAIGITRGHFQKYLNGSEGVPENTISLIKRAFKKYFESSPIVNSDEELVNMAILKVLYKEVAKLKAKAENRDLEACLDDLEDDTKLIMRELVSVKQS